MNGVNSNTSQIPGPVSYTHLDVYKRQVYSWRLDHNDATPKGKRRTLSLREMEKKIQADHFEQIATNGGNMTVLELVEKYTSTKTGVRPTTVAGYGTVINILKKNPFGKRRIDTVRISDAKCWLIHLQQMCIRDRLYWDALQRVFC